MIAVIDYGAGNLFSVKNALDYLGFENVITSDVAQLEKADKIILPGVGAFPDAMERLEKSGLAEPIKKLAQQKPLLGICLGMQMLFEKSYEFKEKKGLGLIKGEVIKLTCEGLKIPHMGWNNLTTLNSSPMMKDIEGSAYVYFVHSFRAETEDEFIAEYTEYGERIPALVQNGNVFGAQFHPEKSGDVGLKMLKNFCEL